MSDRIFDITELSKKLGITRQAIYWAIRHGKLPGAFLEETDGRWSIPQEAITVYQKNRYSREHFYNAEKGEISPRKAASLLNIPLQTVYMMIRAKYLSHKRRKWHIILNKTEVLEFDRRHKTIA